MMKRTLANLFLLTCMVSLMAGCSSNRKKDLEPVELESFRETVEIDKLWSKTIGSGPGKYYHQFQLAVDAQYLYAASEDGKVYQLDKLKGKKRWKVSLDTELTSGVAVDDARVYVGAMDGSVIALSKDSGEQVWVQLLSSEVVSPPAVYGQHLLVHLSNGEIYDLNTVDGSVRWRVGSNVPALTIRGTSQVIAFSDIALTGLANGKLGLFDLNTGQLRGEPRVAVAQGDSEIERIVDVDATPLFIDGKIYAVSYQGKILALDLQSGHVLWTADESSYHQAASGFGNIYVASANGSVVAYDQKSGDIQWVQDGLLRRKLTAPAVVSSYVAVADFEGYLHLLSQINGEFAARVRVNSSGVKAPILVDGENFYSIANNGKLKAYRLGETQGE